MVAGAVQDGHYLSVKAVLLEREQEFPLDPSGCDGRWGQHQNKPVAAPQRRSDLVMPLRRARGSLA